MEIFFGAWRGGQGSGFSELGGGVLDSWDWCLGAGWTTRSTNYSTLITRPPKAFDIVYRCLPKRKGCSDSSSRFLFTQAIGTFS